MKAIILLLVVAATTVSAQNKDFLSRCPTFDTTDGAAAFTTAALYQGDWFIYSQIAVKSEIFSPSSCKEITYAADGTFTYERIVRTAAVTSTGTYTVDATNTGLIRVNIPLGAAGLATDTSRNVNQYVVAGDSTAATGWMIVQSCTNTFFGFPKSYDYAWVLTRERTPSAATITAINTAVAAKLPGVTLATVSQPTTC